MAVRLGTQNLPCLPLSGAFPCRTPRLEPAPHPCLLPALVLLARGRAATFVLPCSRVDRDAAAVSCPALPCQHSLPGCRSGWALEAQMLPRQCFHLLNELMQHPWKPFPQGTAELGQISPGLPSCRAACKQLITFLINVNHVHVGSRRRARRPLPLLQSSFVFQQRSCRAETQCAHKGTASAVQKPLPH